MDRSQMTKQTVDLRQIEPGWDVVAADGEKIGDVSEVRGSYVVVSKGLFFPSERYIPASAIRQVERNRVQLGVRKEEFDSQGWDRMPEDIDTYHEERRTGRGTTADLDRTTHGAERVQLREEELRPRKETRDAGEVQVRKTVRSEQRTIDVPVTREEAVIERRPVDRREAADYEFGDDETIRVPLREERVTAEKRPVVTEEVTVGKRPVTETKRFTDTVRREEAGVVHDGDAPVSHRQAGLPHWDEIAGDFRDARQGQSGTTGRTWEQDEPAYRYGWEMARDKRYQGRRWEDVESDLGTQWGTRYGKHGKWDDMKARAREAWDYGTRR